LAGSLDPASCAFFFSGSSNPPNPLNCLPAPRFVGWAGSGSDLTSLALVLDFSYSYYNLLHSHSHLKPEPPCGGNCFACPPATILPCLSGGRALLSFFYKTRRFAPRSRFAAVVFYKNLFLIAVFFLLSQRYIVKLPKKGLWSLWARNFFSHARAGGWRSQANKTKKSGPMPAFFMLSYP